MVLSQCTQRHTSVNSCVLVIMIAAKILLLFPPLLLLANAQGGGRMGFFARPDFRRPRPWERPTVAPVPDTPMPTEKVTQQITDSPRARTELTTFTPIRSTSGSLLSSAPRLPPRGRVWARPVFGPRPTVVYTSEAITPTEPITMKADDYSPMVSPTTESERFPVTPSTRVPFVENHAQYRDPNNFNSRGRYSPELTHNTEEIHSDSIKATTKLPLPTEQVTELITESTTAPVEDHSPMVSSTSTTTESVNTIAPTTLVPFISSHIKSNESSSNNLGSPPQPLLHLNEHTTELRPTTELTTPRGRIVPTRAINFNSRTRFPPYMSHNLNLPTTEIHPQYIPSDHLKMSSTTMAATTMAATTELPSPTTESAGYTLAPSTNVPFVDDHKRYNDIYLTTKTPIPFEIISTTEVPTATTNHHNSIYQPNQNDENKFTNEPELPLTTAPKIVTMPTTVPQEYITTTTTKAPFVGVHKEYDNGFTSQPPVEYTNGYDKTGDVSKSDDYNAQIYPVYHHETEKVNHYEQSSPATREPERYTVPTTTKVPIVDLHKMYDVGFTSAPPVEYTNGHDKVTGIPSTSDDSEDFIHNIYQNNNHKTNNYDHSVTPKAVTSTQSEPAYQYRYPKTSTEQAAITQTVRHTSSYRYSDLTTKPTTRYTTTTLRTSHTSKVYDIENFKCKGEDGYYPISNQCDDFIECKSGYPIQNSCPDGLHFNPAAKYAEFPCAYPSEVKCESNSVIRQPEPTSECPRRYGYFSLQNGGCDKYIMCQEGQATVMSCPAGLAFSVATSSCDWPSNVPDCLPDVFQGFTCPTPELNEDGQPTHSIYKYRYDKSCKKYIACQRGHPRLLSCDSGLAFDENSESCIDEFDVTDCT